MHMNREQAEKTVRELIANENLVRHHLAAEVCMKAIAQYLKEKTGDQTIDTEKWAMTGLLHDADYELTKEEPHKHTLLLDEEFKKRGFEIDREVLGAIHFHNKEKVPAQESLMGWGIFICDELTGLIVACTLVHPDKKLNSIDVGFVLKRFKQPSFAKGADRTRILPCEEKLDISLPEFVKICLTAMQQNHELLGL